VTRRSEFAHHVAELKIKLQMSLAMRLFSRSQAGIDGFVKRMMKADKPAVNDDPELNHPEN